MPNKTIDSDILSFINRRTRSILNDRTYIDLQLNRVKGFLDFIENPQDTFKSVLVAGTNGKGSTTYFLSNLLKKYSNYKTGRYTGPHLVSIRERYVINEEEIEQSELEEITTFIIEKVLIFEERNKGLQKLTAFEIFTAIAFEYFKRNNVEVAILEIGMGGRLDATNVVKAEHLILSIITNISLDHTKWLGNTLEEIAREKAGIAREHRTLITGAKKQALKEIKRLCKKEKCTLVEVELKSANSYKEKNIETTLVAWKELKKELEISSTNEKEYLRNINYKGRFDYIKDKKVLVDGAHNADAAKELKTFLEKEFQSKKKVFIIGMLDKRYKDYLDNLIEEDDIVICTEPDSHRRTEKKELEKYLKEKRIKTCLSDDLKNALKRAENLEQDLTIVTGSLYLVGEYYKVTST